MRQTITYILLLTVLVCFGTTTKVARIIDGDTFETETGEKVLVAQQDFEGLHWKDAQFRCNNTENDNI